MNDTEVQCPECGNPLDVFRQTGTEAVWAADCACDYRIVLTAVKLEKPRGKDAGRKQAKRKR